MVIIFILKYDMAIVAKENEKRFILCSIVLQLEDLT